MTIFSKPPTRPSSQQPVSDRGDQPDAIIAVEGKLGLETVTIDVEGMMCAGCVSAVSRMLKKQSGVYEAVVNLLTEVAK